MTDIDLKEWYGLNAVSAKTVLGKPITIYGERDFVKQLPSKKDPSKTYPATIHIIYAVDKETNQKIKIFGSAVLHKIIESVKDKLPLDDEIVFVEGRGKFGRGYYKLKNTKTQFAGKQPQNKENGATNEAEQPKSQQ